MSNLTITIDDDLLRAARVKAVQQGTSVNELCRQAISAFVHGDQAEAQARAHARAEAFTRFSNSLLVGTRSAEAPSAKASSRASSKGKALSSRDARVHGMLAGKPGGRP